MSPHELKGRQGATPTGMAHVRSGSRLRRFAALAAAGGPLTLALVWLRTLPREQGLQLFHGGVPLTARLLGHDEPLPPEAVRCENCHRLESDPSPPEKSGGTAAPLVETVGPKLGPSSLTTPVERRGGPASVYTAEAFCRLLRQGLDPAQVMIPQLMPRYTLSDAECNALWTYLISK